MVVDEDMDGRVRIYICGLGILPSRKLAWEMGLSIVSLERTRFSGMHL